MLPAFTRLGATELEGQPTPPVRIVTRVLDTIIAENY